MGYQGNVILRLKGTNSGHAVPALVGVEIQFYTVIVKDVQITVVIFLLSRGRKLRKW